MTVKFIEVGRLKKSWDAECKSRALSYGWLYKQVKNNGVMSGDITFLKNGTIYAGIRPIGKFEVIEKEAPHEWGADSGDSGAV